MARWDRFAPLLARLFGTYDAAFDFPLACTALATVVAATIRSTSPLPAARYA